MGRLKKSKSQIFLKKKSKSPAEVDNSHLSRNLFPRSPNTCKFTCGTFRSCPVVKALVVDYTAPAWHSSLTLGQSNQLELVQKRVCRNLLSSNYQNYDKALCALDLGSLLERRKKLCSKFALKTFRSTKFADWFPKSNKVHGMELGTNRLIYKHKGSTNRFHNSPVSISN